MAIAILHRDAVGCFSLVSGDWTTIGTRARAALPSQSPSFPSNEAIPLASPGKSINQVKPNW